MPPYLQGSIPESPMDTETMVLEELCLHPLPPSIPIKVKMTFLMQVSMNLIAYSDVARLLAA